MVADTFGTASESQLLSRSELHESYFQLVWRRFRRSKASVAGGLMVLMLIILAIFADFFSPLSLSKIDLQATFIPPQRIHFVDHAGKFHLGPFVYNYKYTLDPKTFAVLWQEDEEKAYPIQFFIQGSEYKLLGLIPANLHSVWGRRGRHRVYSRHGQDGAGPVGQSLRGRPDLVEHEPVRHDHQYRRRFGPGCGLGLLWWRRG